MQFIELTSLYIDPSYISLPEQYDFSQSSTFILDPALNIFSISIESIDDKNRGQSYVNENLRVMFKTKSSNKHAYVDSVYCKDLFADQIAAEKNGTSDSSFFTDTYKDVGDTFGWAWICPNVTSLEASPDVLKNMQAVVY